MKILHIAHVKRFTVALVTAALISAVIFTGSGYADVEYEDAVTVVLDAAGGSVSSSTLEVFNGAEPTVLPSPQRTGWQFGGWYAYDSYEETYVKLRPIVSYEDIYDEYLMESDEGGGDENSDDEFYGSYSLEDGGPVCVLTASWKKSVKVRFNGNKGKVKKKSVKATYATIGKEAYGSLPVASRKGYTFKGWYTAKKGGSKVTLLSVVTKDKPHTLYAHWKKAPKKKASKKKSKK
jgi:uncharacterized repeat protein (TIGR02543 family)